MILSDLKRGDPGNKVVPGSMIVNSGLSKLALAEQKRFTRSPGFVKEKGELTIKNVGMSKFKNLENFTSSTTMPSNNQN